MDVRGCKYLFSVFLIIFFTALLDVTASSEENSEISQNKNARFLSMFEIINFPNDACSGDSKNGTCYTSAECDDLGGTKDGDCAQGYGVCCTFSVECGATVNQNNTFFAKPSSFSTGNCAVQVCPDDDICQLRLDFTTFVINGPYSTSDTNLLQKAANAATHEQTFANGHQNSANSVAVVVDEGHCINGAFTVTSSSGSNPPTICGTNTGQHMYIDVKGGSCATVAFDVSAESSLNNWNIQITQFECDYNNLAPSGCNQYFFGENNGIIKTWNYDGGNHLANQDQTFCFRRDSGKTKVCFSYVNSYTDFSVSSGAVANSKKGYIGYTAGAAACCNYGAAGIGGNGGMFDCLEIPGASDGAGNGVKEGANGKTVEGAFCGAAGLYGTDAKKESTLATIKKTVCTSQTPFKIRFLSDGTEESENEVEKVKGIQGFQLGYILT